MYIGSVHINRIASIQIEFAEYFIHVLFLLHLGRYGCLIFTFVVSIIDLLDLMNNMINFDCSIFRGKIILYDLPNSLDES